LLRCNITPAFTYALLQESNFYYISGCNVPGSYVLLAYQQGTSLATDPSIELFIPQAQQADIMWSVPPPSLDEAASSSEATRVLHVPALSDSIINLVKAFPDALFYTLPIDSPLFPKIDPNIIALAKDRGAQVASAISAEQCALLSALHRARLTKTEYEIAQIRKANEISSRAHEVVMRLLGQAVRGAIVKEAGAGVTRPLLPGEWLIEKEGEAEAVFVASCRREG
jgi:Xaa-Pro dipeptidase